jgi:hypothetical protein
LLLSVFFDCTNKICIRKDGYTKELWKSLQITSFLVLEEAPPILLMAIGLDNGCIYCIKGDIARERITRFKLQVDNVSDKSHSTITGLGFRVDGQALQLFAVTPDSVSLFSMHNQPPRRQTLDQIGCNFNSVTMSDRLVRSLWNLVCFLYYCFSNCMTYWSLCCFITRS